MTMSGLESTRPTSTGINDQDQQHDGNYSDEFESDGSLHHEPESSSGKNTKTPSTRQSWRRNLMQTNSNFRSSSMASYGRDEVSQRALSARRLKMNELRNEIQSLQMRMKDMEDENRMLKRVQKRQEKELLRYDSKKGELPDIFKSHTLEVHSLQNQLRQAKSKNMELERNLNSRDRQLNRHLEEVKKLQKLVEEQGLQEKRDLVLKIDSLEDTIGQKDTIIQNMKQQKEMATKSHKRDLATKHAQLKEMQKTVSDLRNQNEKQASLIKEKDKELLRWAMQGPQRRLSSRTPFLETISSRASTSNRETNGFNDETNNISLPLLQSALQSLRKLNEIPPEASHAKNPTKHIDLSTTALTVGNNNQERIGDRNSKPNHMTSPARDKKEATLVQKQASIESSVQKDQKEDSPKRFQETQADLVKERLASVELAQPVARHTHPPETELQQDKKQDLLAKLKAIDNGSPRRGNEKSETFSNLRNGSKNDEFTFGSYQPSFRISSRDSRNSSASVEAVLRSNSSGSIKKSNLMSTLFGNGSNETGDPATIQAVFPNNSDSFESKKKNSLPWA